MLNFAFFQNMSLANVERGGGGEAVVGGLDLVQGCGALSKDGQLGKEDELPLDVPNAGGAVEPSRSGEIL